MTDGNTSKVGSASVYEAKDQVRLASRETPTIVEPRLTRDTASARAAQHCKPQPRVRPGQDQRAQLDRPEYDISYAAIERTTAPDRLTLVQRTSAPSPTDSRRNPSTLLTPTTSPRRTAPATLTPLCLYVPHKTQHTICEPTLIHSSSQAKLHGNKPSKGAVIDAEIAAEEAKMHKSGSGPAAAN